MPGFWFGSRVLPRGSGRPRIVRWRTLCGIRGAPALLLDIEKFPPLRATSLLLTPGLTGLEEASNGVARKGEQSVTVVEWRGKRRAFSSACRGLSRFTWKLKSPFWVELLPFGVHLGIHLEIGKSSFGAFSSAWVFRVQLIIVKSPFGARSECFEMKPPV